MPNEPEDDQVGYGRPPKTSRFKKGQSGNPSGRPKGTRNAASMLQAALWEKVTVRESGRKRLVSKFEIILKQHVNKAAGGDLPSSKFVFHMLAIFPPPDDKATALDEQAAHDQKILAGLMARTRRAVLAQLDEALTSEVPDETPDPDA